jgi:hypothetical protein
VSRGDGWYGFARSPEQTAESMAGLARAAREVERSEALGVLSITVTPPGRVDAALAARYGELGVDRLVLLPPRGDDVEASGQLLS